jgi:hypothetical protein
VSKIVKALAIDGVRSEIRTGYLSTPNRDRYLYTIPFSRKTPAVLPVRGSQLIGLSIVDSPSVVPSSVTCSFCCEPGWCNLLIHCFASPHPQALIRPRIQVAIKEGGEIFNSPPWSLLSCFALGVGRNRGWWMVGMSQETIPSLYLVHGTAHWIQIIAFRLTGYLGLRHFVHYWKPSCTAEACVAVNWICLIAVPICFVVSGDSSEMIVCID